MKRRNFIKGLVATLALAPFLKEEVPPLIPEIENWESVAERLGAGSMRQHEFTNIDFLKRIANMAREKKIVPFENGSYILQYNGIEREIWPS